MSDNGEEIILGRKFRPGRDCLYCLTSSGVVRIKESVVFGYVATFSLGYHGDNSESCSGAGKDKPAALLSLIAKMTEMARLTPVG